MNRCLGREGERGTITHIPYIDNIRETKFRLHIHDFGSLHWVAHHVGMNITCVYIHSQLLGMAGLRGLSCML